ncbi:hypothetical protein [Bacillus wiedmannii]|uniref:hypothetical protein n=1 Tax=Bacillus wiedmannii TaxID=1890302 RepID=UPI002E1B9A9E|nr:hypothetical protein [Bacillus wiedmannii]
MKLRKKKPIVIPSILACCSFMIATPYSAAEVGHPEVEMEQVQIEGNLIQNKMKVNGSYMLSSEVITIIQGNPQYIQLKRKQIHFTQPGTYVIQVKGCLGTVDRYVFEITK